MDLNEYEKVKDLTYQQYCDYLVKKYGPAKGNYFTPSWNKNSAITRTKEGLYIHHRYEDHAIMLGNVNYAKLNPYKWQHAKNLVYCDLLEHLYLHILITEYPAKGKNAFEDVGTGGVINFLVPELNDVYSGFPTKQEWRQICYDKIKNDEDVYLTLVKRFDCKYKTRSEYVSNWYARSFNGMVNPVASWNASKDTRIFNKIKKILNDNIKKSNSAPAKSKSCFHHSSVSSSLKYSRDNLEIIYRALDHSSFLDSIRKNYRMPNHKLIDDMAFMVTCNVADLTRSIIVHDLENNFISPCLPYLCMLLARELIVNRMIKHGDLGEGDAQLYLLQICGHNGNVVNSLMHNNSQFANITFFKNCEEYDKHYRDCLIKAANMSSWHKFEDEGINTHCPYFNIGDLEDSYLWDDLSLQYLGNSFKKIPLFTTLRYIAEPRLISEQSDEDAIINYLQNIIDDLIKIVEEDYLSYAMLINVKNQDVKERDNEQPLDDIDPDEFINSEESKELLKIFKNHGDAFHQYIFKYIYAAYKSIYSCKKNNLHSVSKTFPVFVNWISAVSQYDRLPAKAFRYATKTLDVRSKFCIMCCLRPTDDSVVDDFIQDTLSYYTDYFESVTGDASHKIFYENLLSYDLYPALIRNSYFSNASEYMNKNYFNGNTFVMELYEISLLTSGVDLTYIPYTSNNLIKLATLLPTGIVYATNVVLRDYLNKLSEDYTDSQEKNIFETCSETLFNDLQMFRFLFFAYSYSDKDD